jgi:apolipoprotein N-acyltransferase
VVADVLGLGITGNPAYAITGGPVDLLVVHILVMAEATEVIIMAQPEDGVLEVALVQVDIPEQVGQMRELYRTPHTHKISQPL